MKAAAALVHAQACCRFLALSCELQEAWRTPLGTAVPLSMLQCGNIDPYAVTGTPAIDDVTGMIYVDSLLLVNGTVTHSVSMGLISMLKHHTSIQQCCIVPILVLLLWSALRQRGLNEEGWTGLCVIGPRRACVCRVLHH